MQLNELSFRHSIILTCFPLSATFMLFISVLHVYSVCSQSLSLYAKQRFLGKYLFSHALTVLSLKDFYLYEELSVSPDQNIVGSEGFFSEIAKFFW